MISVVIPTYNRCGPLLRAVDSVLRQSFKEFELIVVDDGSTDRTGAWIGRCGDKRLRYHRIEHSGVARARNFGVRLARYDWVCFLDSDDVWRRHKLSEQVRFHYQNPGVLISQTDDVWIRRSRRVNKMKKHEMREGFLFKESLRRCLVCASSVMIKKSVFWDVGGFDESLVTCEDYDLWLKVLARHPIGFVRKKLVTKFGGHADQLSKKYPVMDRYRVYALRRLLHTGFLNEKQAAWVAEEIRYKEGILKRGATR